MAREQTFPFGSLLIMVRSIFRIIEYSTGIESYLFTHKWPTYALDGGPMLVTINIWAVFYPSDLGRTSIDHRLNGQMTSEQHPLTGVSVANTRRDDLSTSMRADH